MNPLASSFPSGDALLDRMVERSPRIAMAMLVFFAFSLTLAWASSSDSYRALFSGQAGDPAFAGYPIRIAMPQPQPINSQELASVAERNPEFARLDPLAEITGSPAMLGSASSANPSTSADFAQAFSDFGAATAARARDARAAAAIARAESLAPGEFMSLDYDLAKLSTTGARGSGGAAFNRDDGSLTVTKPLLVDGQTRGDATLRIEDGAQILIATSSVANALGSRVDSLPKRISSALATGTGFIPFHELRGAGIAVEYDPIKDRVSLSMPS